MSFDRGGRDPCRAVIGRDPAWSGALRGRRSAICREGIDDQVPAGLHEVGEVAVLNRITLGREGDTPPADPDVNPPCKRPDRRTNAMPSSPKHRAATGGDARHAQRETKGSVMA